MTYRERRARKAERLREWADKRDAKAEQAFAKAEQIMDIIPLGQPILIGHHSEGRHRRDLERMRSGMDQGMENTAKAAEFRQRADEIEHQADRAIYSDDVDAVERLEAKLEQLEGRRDRIKAYNASARKGTPDLSVLTEREREELASLMRVWNLGPLASFPSYALSNLGATIRKDRARLNGLQVKAEQRRRVAEALDAERGES